MQAHHAITPPLVQDQREVFAFLQDPGTYGLTDPVRRIDTHGAAVFLAGQDVYKVKRAVRFPFMDFSTLEKRRSACEAEIMVNRDNAPDLYLGVLPVTRDGEVLCLGGDGPAIEWVVHLRRFDENATLDRLAARGPLGPRLTDQLAQAVVASHRRAPIRDGATATRALRHVLDETVEELGDASDLFQPDRVAAFRRAMIAAFEQTEPLLLRRGARGQVRHCHGDLHLGNLVMIGGAPVLFDAIEFDEAIATSDVLYDLAFLLMDLCKRGLGADANRLMNGYVSFSDDEVLQIEGLNALPLLLSLRAAVRAKVVAALIRLGPGEKHLQDEARAYFDAAVRFLRPVAPLLVAVGGLSGTGKTTLAIAIAPALGRAPGAIHLRSDVERKRLFAVPETARLPGNAYLPEVSARVHARLRELAEAALRAGQAVIVDATYRKPEERAAIAAVATRVGTPFIGLWLEAPTEVLTQRVNDRRLDASDATAAIVATQSGQIAGALAWPRLDASQAAETLQSDALGVVQRSLVAE